MPRIPWRRYHEGYQKLNVDMDTELRQTCSLIPLADLSDLGHFFYFPA
jgi:hypothetical protein